MTDSTGEPISFAYDLVNPYHAERGLAGTLVLDQPLHVGERLRRAFPDPKENADTHEITFASGPEQDWEVVAIEPTESDGRRVSFRTPLLADKNPVMQGRLILRRLG